MVSASSTTSSSSVNTTYCGLWIGQECEAEAMQMRERNRLVNKMMDDAWWMRRRSTRQRRKSMLAFVLIPLQLGPWGNTKGTIST